MEDVFCQMMKETCKCINSSINDTNVYTIVRSMKESKRVSKHFDLKHVDSIESNAEIANLNQALVDDPRHRRNF